MARCQQKDDFNKISVLRPNISFFYTKPREVTFKNHYFIVDCINSKTDNFNKISLNRLEILLRRWSKLYITHSFYAVFVFVSIFAFFIQ